MTSQEFRSLVVERVSDQARIDGEDRFSIPQGFDAYVTSQRQIRELMSRETGRLFVSSYDFNVRRASYFPEPEFI